MISSRDVQKCKEAAEEINDVLQRQGAQGKVVVGPPCSIRSEEDIEHLVSDIALVYTVHHILGDYLFISHTLSSFINH